MAGIEFHNTRYGHAFFEHQLPTLTRNIGRLADEMKRLNDRNEIDHLNLLEAATAIMPLWDREDVAEVYDEEFACLETVIGKMVKMLNR